MQVLEQTVVHMYMASPPLSEEHCLIRSRWWTMCRSNAGFSCIVVTLLVEGALFCSSDRMTGTHTRQIDRGLFHQSIKSISPIDLRLISTPDDISRITGSFLLILVFLVQLISYSGSLFIDSLFSSAPISY